MPNTETMVAIIAGLFAVISAAVAGRLNWKTVRQEKTLPPYEALAERVSTLEADKSAFIDFTLPQQELPKLRVGMPVRALLQGSSTPLAEGEISAIDPAVDPMTRAIKVRASLPGVDDQLRPGMFLRVQVVLPEKTEVVTVPQTAIVHASYGDSVFVGQDKPGPDGKPRKVAQQHFVKLGVARGDFVSVLDGLQAEQDVVTAGAFKLRNGIPLKVNNTGAVQPSLAPTPENR